MYVCMHICVCMYVCKYVFVCVCVYVCMYVCMYVHMYIRMYVCTYVRMYVHNHCSSYIPRGILQVKIKNSQSRFSENKLVSRCCKWHKSTCKSTPCTRLWSSSRHTHYYHLGHVWPKQTSEHSQSHDIQHILYLVLFYGNVPSSFSLALFG